jgi:hypothetical protein
MPPKKIIHTRNNSFFDIWSIVHLVVGVMFGWIMTPVLAIILMAAWEPIEIFVLSPLLARRGIIFGQETLKNSLSDILFDVIGVLLGAWGLAHFINPPFFLS